MEVHVRKVVSFFSILAILGVLAPATQASAATDIPRASTPESGVAMTYNVQDPS